MAPYEPRSSSSGVVSGGTTSAETFRNALTGPRRFEPSAGPVEQGNGSMARCSSWVAGRCPTPRGDPSGVLAPCALPRHARLVSFDAALHTRRTCRRRVDPATPGPGDGCGPAITAPAAEVGDHQLGQLGHGRFGGRSVKGDPSMLEDVHTIAHLERLRVVVGDDEDGDVSAYLRSLTRSRMIVAASSRPDKRTRATCRASSPETMVPMRTLAAYTRT
jgi:hypothetical protein